MITELLDTEYPRCGICVCRWSVIECLWGVEVTLAGGEWRSADGTGTSDNLSLPGFIAIELSQNDSYDQDAEAVADSERFRRVG